MLIKLADTVDMSFDIPKKEKDVARSAMRSLDAVINALNLAKDELDKIYIPFKKIDKISPEALDKKRGRINHFKQDIKGVFNKVEFYAFKTIQELNHFNIDTQILEIINSFKDNVQNLEKQVVIFMGILDDYEDAEFKDNVISSIDSINKQCAQLEKFIKDRMIEHVEKNILVKNWVTDTSDITKLKIENKQPLVVELFNERQNALQNATKSNNIPAIEKRPQTLNPGNIQRIYTPTDIRESDGTGEY